MANCVSVMTNMLRLYYKFTIPRYECRKAVFCPGFQKGRVPSEKGTLAW